MDEIVRLLIKHEEAVGRRALTGHFDRGRPGDRALRETAARLAGMSRDDLLAAIEREIDRARQAPVPSSPRIYT